MSVNSQQGSGATSAPSEGEVTGEKPLSEPTIIPSESRKRDHQSTYRGGEGHAYHQHHHHHHAYHAPPHYPYHHQHHHYPPHPASRSSAERRDSSSSTTSNAKPPVPAPHPHAPNPYAPSHGHHHHHSWWAHHHQHHYPHGPAYGAHHPPAAPSQKASSSSSVATNTTSKTTTVPETKAVEQTKVVEDSSTSETINTEKTNTITKSPSQPQIAPSKESVVAAEEAKTARPLVPTERDICFSKGVGVHNNPHNGNYKYMQLIAANKGQYFRNLTKRQKTLLTRKIVDFVLTSGVRFLARDTAVGGKKGDWYDIGFARSIEETSAALRKKGDWAGLYESDDHSATEELASAAVSPSSSSDDSSSSSDQESQSSKYDELGSPKLIIPPHLQKFYRPPTRSTTPASVPATSTSASTASSSSSSGNSSKTGAGAHPVHPPRPHAAYPPPHHHHPYWPPPSHHHPAHHAPSSVPPPHAHYHPHYHHHMAASAWHHHHRPPPHSSHYYHQGAHAGAPPGYTPAQSDSIKVTTEQPKTAASSTTAPDEPPAKRARVEPASGEASQEPQGAEATLKEAGATTAASSSPKKPAPTTKSPHREKMDKAPLSTSKMARRVSDDTVTTEADAGKWTESVQKENAPNSIPTEVAVVEYETRVEKNTDAAQKQSATDSFRNASPPPCDMGGLAALSAAAFLRLCDNAHSVVASKNKSSGTFSSSNARSPPPQHTIIF